MSEMTVEQQKENIDQKALELAQDFSYDGYQVVRRELFAHLREPAVVIRRDSVTFNTACIAGLEDAVYIQILVNQDNKRMVVRFRVPNIIRKTGILQYIVVLCKNDLESVRMGRE